MGPRPVGGPSVAHSLRHQPSDIMISFRAVAQARRKSLAPSKGAAWLEREYSERSAYANRQPFMGGSVRIGNIDLHG
jgi:alpha-D-ribose 1-methylphosphonate 5-triphosphate synthase subunit PhnI